MQETSPELYEEYGYERLKSIVANVPVCFSQDRWVL